MLYQCQVGRTMAARDATSGSLSEESSALDLPSVCDIRDYVLQRPSQEANSEAFSSLEFHSLPCSSDVDPGLAWEVMPVHQTEVYTKKEPLVQFCMRCFLLTSKT
ncbi:shieldin complex subunit 1 isoform X4 [Chlorocebus sabaeus]|uniref:shieldin complex subunit 1 isoform X4 n=1 Tax=Chlorocebus sabaeus TaxID=60711 RepID=UPI003BFA1C63